MLLLELFAAEKREALQVSQLVLQITPAEAEKLVVAATATTPAQRGYFQNAPFVVAGVQYHQTRFEEEIGKKFTFIAEGQQKQALVATMVKRPNGVEGIRSTTSL